MDLSLTNTTPFPAALIALEAGAAAATSSTLIVKGTFGLKPRAEATRHSKPAPLAAADVPGPDDGHGAPMAAARYESDFVPFKPRADCLCVGTAYPPGGAAAQCVVSFGVGRDSRRRSSSSATGNGCRWAARAWGRPSRRCSGRCP